MNVKFIFLAIFVSIFYSQTLAQTRIEGKVQNHENNAIQYSTIGIKHSKIGSIANEFGEFFLEIPDSLAQEQLIFSANGYDDKSISLAELKNNSTVVLFEKSIGLTELIVKGNEMKKKVIGQEKRPMLTFSRMFDKDLPTIEQGSIFSIDKKTRLSAYNFYIMPSSHFQSITLKLNIYNVKDGIPTNALLDEQIIYSTTTTGWQTIDLSEYHLSFNQLDQIAITLQLVQQTELNNSEFIFGISAKKSTTKNLFYRYQSQGDWEKSSGQFIANISVKYSSETNSDPVVDDPEETLDLRTKEVIAYYKHKEKARKTNYGNNKNGKFIDLTDSKIYYEDYGKGTPLILLHGNNGSINDFYQQIPALAKHYHVIAMDTRGQGKSTDLSRNEYSYEKFADDLYKVIQHLNLKKVDIVGWSDGGNTGLIFNNQHPEYVRKLVTIGANSSPEGIEETLINQFKIQLANNKPTTNSRLIKLMLNHPSITKSELNTIENPVLVIAGSDDVIKEDHTKELHRSLRNAELKIIPKSTHYVVFEQASSLNHLILDFLRK